METKNYEIIIVNGLTGKIVNKHVLHDVTREQAEENAYKSRAWFTYTTETYCEAIIREK